MPYSILILDDDADFNSLLTDIFEQADYVVTSLTDPIEALDVFRETDYDLVVMDQKMPQLSGTEFMREIKHRRPEVPVIMVSGFLENETIRELIRDGVGGIFLKPLNIFSLLERTGELVEEAQKLHGSSEHQSGTGVSDESTAELGFDFHSFACKSGVSVAFAEKLYGLRNFKSTLTLIGEPGTHFRRICDDLQGFEKDRQEPFMYLNASAFDEVQTLALIEEAQNSDAERVTFVLLDFETMEPEQKKLATQLAKNEEPFDGLQMKLRTIFCLNDDSDSLFSLGQIDESLYILMGTSEIRIPALRECQSEIGIMAQQMLFEIAQEKSMRMVPRLDSAAHEQLRHYPWPGNFRELADLLRHILEKSPDGSISGAAIQALVADGSTEPLPLPTQLDAFLAAQQTDYFQAAAILARGDREQVAKLLKIEPSQVPLEIGRTGGTDAN